ncbi:lipoyl protein ligase domain-containing protein [Natronomonas sp. EA1]|uniref:lipoyl protein ligase domain-containing protein n=1 Tax=Natronomonas sp. EA1 TaxID=3421655 RepID=UPI003EC12F7E
MRVIRGRAASIEADRAVTAALREDVAESGEAAVRVWAPHRQIAFGRRDARAPGYARAREAAAEHEFPSYERAVGGRAVAYTGTTLAFVRVTPLADVRRGMDERYDAAVADVRRALSHLGVEAERGEPLHAFCPGDHSLSSRGKIVGIAQRVRKGAAQTAGCLVVDGHEEIAAVLTPIYEALEVPFDPDSVGSLARAGGTADVETARGTLERALVGDEPITVEEVRGV